MYVLGILCVSISVYSTKIKYLVTQQQWMEPHTFTFKSMLDIQVHVHVHALTPALE